MRATGQVSLVAVHRLEHPCYAISDISSAAASNEAMKRWIVRILCSLIIGAVTTVAIAWGLTFWVVIGDGNSPNAAITTPAGEFVPYLHWSRTGIERIKWHLYLARGEEDLFPITRAPRWSEVASCRSYNDGRYPFEVNVRLEVGSGWPMLSMRTCYAVDPTNGTSLFEPRGMAIPVSDHLTVPQWHLARERALPLMPIWIGFALDTAAFGVIWLLPIVGLASLRARRRIRRGRCEKCGYDLRQDPAGGCPECGWGR